jgi:hypothetical protein
LPIATNTRTASAVPSSDCSAAVAAPVAKTSSVPAATSASAFSCNTRADCWTTKVPSSPEIVANAASASNRLPASRRRRALTATGMLCGLGAGSAPM